MFACCRGPDQTALHLGSRAFGKRDPLRLRQDLHVHLPEWMPASRQTSARGLDECACSGQEGSGTSIFATATPSERVSPDGTASFWQLSCRR